MAGKPVPALELHRVCYAVEGKKILDSVNWTVGQEEHWAILGPNGSGKTTLLKVACGYIWPNCGGEIFRNGEVLINLRDLRKSIGWVTSSLPPAIPTREKVLRTVVSGKFAQIGLLEGPWWKPAKKDFTQAEKYLDQMGCADLMDQEFGTLSQGEQQKVLIARARMTEPYLMFLDEPCAGMDPGGRENFLASLEQLGKQKKVPSLIYVTHHVEEVLPLFHKMLILKKGRVLETGTTKALLKQDVLKKLYNIDLSLTEHNGRYWPQS
ncbi:MAG: ATP-binding cassette domain-containing protein [Deltaproteobacteria bacterium]|nr:ATP-binding cassette domain-containing protein [Deltaproteobacteria bacterium]